MPKASIDFGRSRITAPSRLGALIVLCIAGSESLGSAHSSVLVEGIPHVQQKPDFCGEACAEMVLRKLGHAIDQDAVFNASGLDPALGRGCYTKELITALQRIGFKLGPVVHGVAPQRAGFELETHFAAMHEDLVKGIPSIVCMHYDDRPNTTEHFRLVIGYDATTDEVIYHEPAEADGANRRMARVMFLELWPLKYSPTKWTLIRMRMEPRTIKAPAGPAGLADADYAQHVMARKERLPSSRFTIVIEKPFVVIGDEDPQVVRRRAATTVRWAVGRLKAAYFAKDPAEVLDIWLFKDEQSYYEHAQLLWDDKPGTPFGYYSPTHKALVMNIATGGGTLIHEIVHPFIHANFPECPAWFNEGLGSLYEQCADRSGRIVGLTNWRLAGLKKAIEGDDLPTFEELCSTSSEEFYSSAGGDNYAQARYLCLYLQERGLLQRFYREFHANRESDPAGYETLKKVLGEKDMDAFTRRWESWVKQLRFP